MHSIRVNLGPRSYDIAFAPEQGDDVGRFVRDLLPRSETALVVADANTAALARTIDDALQGVNFRTSRTVVPAGEASKSFAHTVGLYDILAELPADRGTAVVAAGGGVVGDLAGFTAATYNRGLPLVMLPTTLLAMVDSSVGGKVGVNHPKGKNLIGAFHQPAGVWINTAFLVTLPDREYRSGLAEVVKYGVILDADLFTFLERNIAALLAREPAAVQHVVARSCQLKADIVEEDERELTGLRSVLNYGHTFGHAFETVGGYGTWLHGEAVAAGMVCAAQLAERRGLIPTDLAERQLRLLTAYGLPTAPRVEWPIDALLDAMRRDKKAAAGRMRFVLPTRLGHVELFDDVPESLVREVLRP